MPKCPCCDCTTFSIGKIQPIDSMISYKVIYCRDCDRIIAVLPPDKEDRMGL